MSIATMLRQDVTILNPGSTTDTYGNVVPDWANPVTTVEKGLLEATQSTEVSVGRDTVVSDWRLFLSLGSVVTSYSRVQISGMSFEVVGLPSRWDQGSPASWHTECHLVSSAG